MEGFLNLGRLSGVSFGMVEFSWVECCFGLGLNPIPPHSTLILAIFSNLSTVTGHN